MKRRDIIRRCKCPCNRELKDRYKGREKIFYDSPVCRKVWGDMSPKEQKARLKEIEQDLKRQEIRAQEIRDANRKPIKKKIIA